jgi:hypothetical protein
MVVPRRRQPALTIRSARAIELLKSVRDGRSQAQIIEDALEREVTLGKPIASNEERISAIRAIQAEVVGEPLRYDSMADFDAKEYDERGLPR